MSITPPKCDNDTCVSRSRRVLAYIAKLRWPAISSQLVSLVLTYALLLQLIPFRANAATLNGKDPRSAKANQTLTSGTSDKKQSDQLFNGEIAAGVNASFAPEPQSGSGTSTITDAVVSRHKPTLNSGRIDGTLRVLLGESFTITGSAQLTSDLYLPGAPTIQLSGGAQDGGETSDGGAATPGNYTLSLTGGNLPGRIHTNVDAIQLPTDFPNSVPAPSGTRTVTVSSQSGVAGIGNWQTVRDLNVTGSHITIDVSPGNYGTFTVNGNSQLNFTAGTYNFSNTFNLDSSATIKATGLVAIDVGQNLTITSGAVTLGSYTSPGDVHLNVLGTTLNVNGSSQVSGLIRAYNGAVSLNGTSQVRGQVIANSLTLSGGKVIGAVWPAQAGNGLTVFGPRRFDRTTGPPNQYVEQFSLPVGVVSPYTLHIQNGEPDGSNRVSSATVKLNGVDILTPSDLNQNVAGLDRTVTLAANNQLNVTVASVPGSYLIINIAGIVPVSDTTPPTVAITSPANNSTTTDSQVTVSGTAIDSGPGASGVAHVYVNNVEAAYNSSSGTWTLANVSLALGSNQITVRAVDQAGNQTTSSITVTRQSPTNHAPTADAGPDQTLTLPETASLHGTATDDGLPTGSTLTTTWSKVSGTGIVTFANASALNTTASLSISGTYVLRLTASDGALSTTDDITITVKPQNQPPTVSAGQDQTIALPHTATLNGTVTDDGLPAGSSVTTTWSQVSGPGTVTFEDATLTDTNATFSAPGTYVLRLTATDSELTSRSDVTITVQPENHAPTVSAGQNQIVSLPNAAAQLNGSASDDGLPFGSTLSVSWSMVSGPGSVVFDNPNSTATIAHFAVAGLYVLRLTATDGELSSTADVNITVTPPNQAPTVNAGADQTITLPNSASLNGTVGDDGLPIGGGVSTLWSAISGPGTVTFANPNVTVTTAAFSAAGTYVLRLSASDSQLSSSDDVVVTVIAQNHAPTVDAGPDQTITLPNSAQLNGTATDDGLPAGSSLTVSWGKIIGPGPVAFANPNAAATNVSFSVAGTYTLRLTASDSELSSTDDIVVTVNPQNLAPTVDAGADQTITLPNAANLNGSASDDGLPTGSSVTTTWTKVSGPGTVTFGNPNVTVTTAAFSAAGTYVLRLTASDSQLSSSDDVIVTVNPQNQPPTVNAGQDQNITLPSNATLNGTASDDGLPSGSTLSISWTKVSGPGTVTFTTPSAAATSASFSVAGTYTLRLTASDSLLSSSDDVVVTVIPENHAPTVDAGPDQTITLPNAANLNGSVSDDGLPTGSTLTTTWSKVSGPGTVTFANPSVTVTTASFSQAGTYVLRLTANDSQLTTTDDITITVNAQNAAPTVNAGADQTISSCTTNFSGTATDDGLPAGSTLTISWSKVGGPGNVTFADAGNLNTTATFSAAGNYVLRLTASDSQLSSSDDVAITVNLVPATPAPARYFEPTPYLSFQDSPFRTLSLSHFYLEDFEDHLLNTPGVSADAGGVVSVTFGPSGHDSVDADDGVIDGSGSNGDDFFNPNGAQGTKFTFNANVLGSLPTHAGLVWTDGAGDVYFEAFDRNGVSMGLRGPYNLPDNSYSGTTAEDRFLGAYNPDGISAIRVLNTIGGMEIDHLQYGFGGGNSAPTVNAGPDQSLFLPATTANLNGTVTDDGLPACGSLSISWSKVSGPSTVTFANPTAAVTAATFGASGAYVLRLTASDSLLTASDDIAITITANQPPVADFSLPSSSGAQQLTVVSYSSYNGYDENHPRQLLDSSAYTFWQAAVGQVTNQYIKFGTAGGQLQLIDRVALEPWYYAYVEGNVRDFEVQVSSTSSNDSDFHTVLSATMAPNSNARQEFAFSGGPVVMRFIKLVLKNNYGQPNYMNLASFQALSSGNADGIVSFLSRANSALNQSPAVVENGGAIYNFSFGGTYNTPDPMLGYNRGGWVTTSTANQFATIQLGRGRVYTLDGVKLATWYDSGYGYPTGVKDFEVWVSATTPDDSSFTKVLTATVVFNPQLQTFLFPAGPVQARYVKYVPLNNGGGGPVINTQSFDVIAQGTARVVAASGSYEYGNLPAEQAFDGNENTFWYGPNNVVNDVWVKTSLEDETIHKVFGVRINALNSYYYGQHGPKDFDIRVSTTTIDDSAFTTVYSGTLSGAYGNLTEQFLFPTPLDAKYVQFYWKNSYSGSLIAVSELQVLADSAHGSTLVGYSSSSDPSYQGPANALDIDTTNQPWITAGGQNTDQWLKLSLPSGDLATIDHVALKPGYLLYGYSGNQDFSVSPKDFEIQISTTDAADASFSTAFSGTLLANASLQHFYFTPVQARYVRLLLKNNYGGGSIALHGFYVYRRNYGSTDARFIDRSTDADGQVVSWAWDFGDGGTSNVQSPSHHYSTAGAYNVTLTVTDDGGLTGSHQMLYQATAPLIADFVFSPVVAYEGVEFVRFTDITQLLVQPNSHRIWDFGNGSTVTDLYTSTYYPYQFPDNGTFNVTMTIGDSSGIRYVVTKPMTVLNLPPSVTVEAGKTVVWGEQWTNAPHMSDPSPIDSQSLRGVWDFGDGQTSTCLNCNNASGTIAHSYAQPGSYNATLTVSDKDGGAGSATATYTVNKRPTALVFSSPPAQTTGSPLVIHASLMDTFANAPLSGKPVQFTLNGAVFNAMTGANGVAEVSVPLPAGTKIDITIGSFGGDAFYASCSGVGVPVTAGGNPPGGAPSNAGTNFWLMFPQNYSDGYGTALQRLFITSPVDTNGTVTIPGLNFTQNFTVQANTVVTVPLGFAQVYESDVVQNKGIHVTSAQPVIVYGLNQRYFTSDAFLGLPANAIGKDYYVLTYSNMGFAPASQVGMVGAEDGTTVTITPAVTTGVRQGGVPYNVVLNQGQTYLLQNNVPTTAGDLTGTRVTSDKPIAVFGSHEAATIPAEAGCCADHLVEQLPPTSAWGKRFATIPIATRTKGDFFRIIAAQDNTAVYLNGNLLATLNRGQWIERIIKDPAEFIATQPIMVAQLSTSIFYDAPTTGLADPFMMIIPPYSQFLNHYTISTPAAGFAINYANIVAPTALISSITLDGAPIPASRFTPIGVSGYSGAQVPITIGVHNLDGPASFGVFVYGFNQDEGYGYPGGMNMNPVVQSVNVVVTPETSDHPISSQACVLATITNQDQFPIGGRTINFTVTGANSLTSSATTSAAGQATFCYTGTNLGSDLVRAVLDTGSGTASVQWLTNVQNHAPVVNAGVDKTITLPAPATLQGSATDDGLPANTLNVSWAKVSGPGNVAFANSAATVTTATFASAGVYVLRLTASDTALSTSDDVQITVNPTPSNQAPTATAGSDQSAAIKGNLIVNPENEQPLVNGKIPGWVVEQGTTWTQGNSSIPGLPDPHIGQNFFYVGADAVSYAELRQDVDVSAFANSIAAGTQQFEMQVWVRAAGHSYPSNPRVVVEFRNARNDGVLGTLDYGNGYAIGGWNLTEATQAAPVGTRWIRVRLIAIRNGSPGNDAYFDSVSLRPVGNAGVKLNGTVTDDGLPYGSSVSANWTAVSGPGAVTFTNPNSASAGAGFVTPGTYVLRLTSSDGQLSSSDDVTVTINPQNQPPVVNAGAYQTITLPQTATLNGIVNDDGLPVGSTLSAHWRKDQGPGIVTFANPNAASTTASFSTPGYYALHLTAEDSEYAAASDVVVYVNPATNNQPPVVNAGPDRTISLPTNTVTLNGAAADDGLPGGSLSVLWTTVSGPGTVNFGTPNAAVTTAQFSTAGTYVLRLTASDGDLSTSDDVNVTLTAANQAPTVNAGADQATILSAGAQLNGTVSDDGLPVGNSLTTTWSKVSGPGTVTFLNPNVTVTGANFSATGTYVLRLTASDGALSASDNVTITVNQDVPPPTVQITAPADGASVTEPTIVTGSVSGGAWTLEYSLDSTDDQNSRVWTAFASGNGATTGTLGSLDPTMMLNGLFDIRLSATDQYGQTSRTRISVIVERNLKVGNFTVSFTDLSIPVAGVPMEVTRTYDSRDKRVGDFGFGWTLGLHNIRVEKTGVVGLKWYETVSQEVFPNYCLEPIGSHAVTVTFPGGKVFKFQPNVAPHCQRNAPITSANITFTPMPGTVGKLETVGSSDVQIDGSVPGPVNLIGFGGGVDIFNSFVFKFTAQDGTAYIIDQRSGLQSLSDLNGNTLTIGAGGIAHSSGQSISFVRDGQGRITTITDPAQHSMHYQYDANGNLDTYTDADGNVTKFTYTQDHFLLTIQITSADGTVTFNPASNSYGNGRLKEQIDAFHKTISYDHDIANRRETITDRLGNQTVFEYDSAGNVVYVRNPEGGETRRSFDENGNVLTETNPQGTSTFQYDANDNLKQVTDAFGNVSKLTFNQLGQITSALDAKGNLSTLTYNESTGNLLLVRDSEGNETQYSYGLNGLKNAITRVDHNDPTHPVATTFDYFDNSYLKTETDPLGNVTNYTYDANGNRKSLTVKRTNSSGQPEDITTSFEYDKLNRPVKTVKPDSTFTQVFYNLTGQRSSVKDQFGRETKYEYDALGQLIKVTFPDNHFQETRYDAEGRQIQTIDRAGRTTAFTYDKVGHLTETLAPDGGKTTSKFDLAGRVIEQSQWRDATTKFTTSYAYGLENHNKTITVTDAVNHSTKHLYDENGNLFRIVDAANRTTTFEYDADNRCIKITYPDGTFEQKAYDGLGRLTAKTDQAQKTTHFTYDSVSRVVRVTDALNQPTNYTYDEVGNQIEQTDANNHTTRFEYDQLGRRTKRTLPAGMSELFTYDLAGNLKTRRDFNGRLSTYDYDSMNRMIQKTPDPVFNVPSVTYTYTATGQRQTMTDASGLTTYGYDERDRLLSKSTPQGTLTYAYDKIGNLRTLRSANPNGAGVDYDYDELNRVSRVSDNRLPQGANNTTYSYDAVGNLQSYTYPNAVQTVFNYDSLNRLTDVTTARTAMTLARYTYELGAAGNRLSVTELSGRKVSYGYDDTYKLTSETITGSPNPAQNGAIDYTYDAVGNRLTRNSSLSVVPSQTPTYDTNDRLNSDTYDNNGNTLTANGTTYRFDWENQLQSVNNGAVTYLYDGDGNRVGKAVPGFVTRYLVDTNNLSGYPQVVDEIVNGVVVRTYTYGHDLISQNQLIGGTWRVSFYGKDGHGSVRYLTDALAVVTDTYDYDAFGNLIAASGSTPNERLFAGEQFDANVGFYYLRARYMNPNTARFLSMDSSGGSQYDPLSLHKYLYANANPVSNVDPSGHSSIAEVTLTCALVGALAGGLYGGIRAGMKSGWNPKAIVLGTLAGAIAGFAAPYIVVYGGAWIAAFFGVPLATGIITANALLFTGATALQLQQLAAAKTDDERNEIFASIMISSALFAVGFADFYAVENAPIEIPPSRFPVDVSGMDRVAEIRLTLGVDKGKNIAFAAYDVDGEQGELIGISGERSPTGTVDVPTERRFVTVPTGTNQREFESEGKILEYMAASKVKPNSSGRITLYSERPPCDSCAGLVDQFRRTFPGVTLNVSSGP